MTLMRMSIAALLGMGLGACGEETAEGQACANVGSYGCFDNAVHLCKSTGWEQKVDCSDSPTDDCQCIVYQGLGKCTTGGANGSIDAVAANICQE